MWWTLLITSQRFRRRWGALVIGCCLCELWTSVLCAEPQPPTAEVRDVLLLLENGPLHLRFHVSIAGKSPMDARRDSLQRVLKELDADGDGKLSRQEADRSPLFREKQRPKAEAFLREIGASRGMSPKDIAQRFERIGGETVVYRQNESTAQSDTAVFTLLDENGDGVVDDREIQQSIDLLLAMDADDDECVTLDEMSPAPDPPVNPVVAQLNPTRIPGAMPAEVLRDTNQSLLPAHLLQKYDRNRDRKLSAAELGWTADRVAVCDADQDQHLNLKELGTLHKSPVDIELAVDVVQDSGRQMLRVLEAAGNRLDGERFPDLATVGLPSAVITFSTQDVDPYQASLTLALRTFNQLDLDNNGYLDRDETMARERFARGLFDQIDADGDGKIFGEEMKEFIQARGEPVAMSCQITVYDDGAGFFSTLDSNSDRRLSLREMRYAGTTLTTMERDEQPGLSQHEPARRYRIEFERGVFNPFGMTDRPQNTPGTAAMVETIKPRSVGPIWFQRWDRNNDGDLSWREFLGPRDAFEQIDADRDELIDPKEAEAAIRLAEQRRKAAATVRTGNVSHTSQPATNLTSPNKE